MTFSICASVDDSHGVAVATNAIAVGGTAPFVSRAGAVCTQATTSSPLGVRTCRSLERGTPVADAVATLLADDPNASVRQVHAVDHHGETAAETGSDCVPHADHLVGSGFTVAGNMLEGPAVLTAIAEAFEASSDRSLAERLLIALRAGEDAGGDRRGPHAQSAAIRVFDPEEPHLAHDLRVDEHDRAVDELERIHELATTAGDDWATSVPPPDLQRHPE